MGLDKLADIVLEHLTKHFGTVVAVEDLNLRVRDKEFLTLLGPSGCGKTTTMRLVAGLETPTSGNIYIGDRLINDVSPRDRDVAMVFQNYALYPHMKVYDNLAFPLRMRKYAKLEIEKKIKKTASLLKIETLLDRKPKELSGGQQQRVALGRAIIREPKAFLMDEPLSNLDAKLRVYMRAELKNLQKDLGVTTVYVTHDQVEAMTMSDRIALMNQGVLQQLSSPDEMYVHPSNEFVAGFIGSPPMNFVGCSFTEKDDKGVLMTSTFALDVTPLKDVIREKSTGSELVLGVRPEDLSIRPQPRGDDQIEAQVFVIEPLGSELLVDLKIGEDLLRVKASSLDFKVGRGDKVWVTINKDKIHIFDKKTGNAIV